MAREDLEGAQAAERRQAVKVHSLDILYHQRKRNDLPQRTISLYTATKQAQAARFMIKD